jgi:hypothetical protein
MKYLTFGKFFNGISRFNITKILEYICENPEIFVPESISVKAIYREYSDINESHLYSVDLAKPIILAEISPERYNVIDGNHRLEKAHRQGVETLMAYRIKAEQHIKFLVNRVAYEKYIEYWNGKIKDMRGLSQRPNKHTD